MEMYIYAHSLCMEHKYLDFEKIWYEDSCLINILKINEVLIF